jgi:prevent-host-death family protein
MPRLWQLHQAKAKLSELVARASSEGPQIITYRGAPKAVVLSVGAYKRLKAAEPSLVDHLLAGPKLDDRTVRLINKRAADRGREVEL